MRCKRGYRTLDECLRCYRRCIIAAPIEELVDKSAKGYYAKRDKEYHVTSLLGCPRKAVLGRVCGEYAVPLNIWKMHLGTLCHSFMEDHPMGKGVGEQTLKHTFDVDVNGVIHKCVVVGRFDWLSHIDDMIHDFKFVWSTQYMPGKSHYRQLATYYLIGTKSGHFDADRIKGGQVDYVEAATGIHHPYCVQGDTFMEIVKDMEHDIPKMLKTFIEAREIDKLPPGEPDKGECAYCSTEFRAFCKECIGNRVKYQPGFNSVRSMKAAIESYRRENTPPDVEL